MALFSTAPAAMKPTALTLNILVAAIGTIRFCSAGYFSWRTFWPFAIASIPASFIGGLLTLPGFVYKAILGAVLIFNAVRLFFFAKSADEQKVKPAPILAA